MDTAIPKNRVMAKKFRILHFFLVKKTYNWWDKISIDQHSDCYVYFIVDTITYDKYYTAKILVIGV